MSRKRKEPLEAIQKVVSERQPIKMSQVWVYVKCYLNAAAIGREATYKLIRDNYDVDDNNYVKEKAA